MALDREHTMLVTLDYLAGLGHRNANGGLKYPGRSESIAEHKAFWRHVKTVAGECADKVRKEKEANQSES